MESLVEVRLQHIAANIVSTILDAKVLLGLRLTDLPGRMGIPMSSLSGFEKFEAPDPAEWTARGYAVVNIDSRGSWDAEGYLW
jgi:predicted acyl esterase